MSEISAIIPGATPTWDVSKTTAFPVELQSKGSTVGVYVYLTPYTSGELKAILRQAVAGYKRDNRDVEIEREDKKIYTPLFDGHFVKLGNSNGTPQAQRQWFDARPELKPSIVEYTFGGLRRDLPEVDETEGGLDILADFSEQTLVYQNIYDPTTNSVVRVDMTHNYSHPTEQQYREYRSARRNRFIQKRSLWTISENHNLLEKLYDAAIQSIDGMAVDGKPCTAATKPEWISGVPLWHKLFIVDQIFADIIEKNV
jgi:hypothetical protein